MGKNIIIIFSALFLAIFLCGTVSAAANDTVRVSVDSSGIHADENCYNPAISANGEYVVFHSYASNLVSGDTNGVYDVFIHDKNSGNTTRVSVASNGTQANGQSLNPAISADGRYVAFVSESSNLVSGDTNGCSDIFVHDTNSGQTIRVSVASNGTQGNDYSGYPFLSADGRYVVFHSYASNLVSEDSNGCADVFLHDMITGNTTRVSLASNGTQGNRSSLNPVISADGRYVTFYSYASNLVSGDTNECEDVFLHDTNTGITIRVSVASNGTQGNADSIYPFISADGRYVVFTSYASNFVPGDTYNGYSDVFVHDTTTGITELISADINGNVGSNISWDSSISADGRYVAFMSNNDNMVLNDINGNPDVFLRDREKGTTKMASVASDGTYANTSSQSPCISSNGQFVSFSSAADNLVTGDTNGREDIFVHENELSAGNIINVYPGQSIQTAINNACVNDTIIVNSGTYVENLNFYKQLRLIANGTAIIQASNQGNNVISIFSAASGSKIQGFTIMGALYNSACGIGVITANNLNITGNNIISNFYGIFFTGGSNNNIYQNNIYSNTYGILLDNSVTRVNFNRILNNSGYNIYGNGLLVDATNNWWGINYPYGFLGNVNTTPYLIMNLNALPVCILTLNTSTITADLTMNSNSQDTSSLGYLPDGLQVNYSTDLGVLSNSTKLINGKSTVILNPNGQNGTATITATLDYQSRTTTVQVVEGPILNNRTGERFLLIQDAINSPNTLNNDTIIVNSGTYLENVIFNKQLRLIAIGTAIIQAANINNPVIDLTASASGSTIQGFIIRGASNSYGIRAYSVNNLNITSNNITLNYYGILFAGGSNNNIYQNNIYSNNYGIFLDSSVTCVNFNRIFNNTGYNIYGNGPLTDATNNWWGANSPYGIVGNVNPSPYLIMNLSALPVCISTLNTSTVTADLTRNSNSQDTSSLGYLPDGIQVNYSTDLGVLSNSTKLINGKSTVILNPNSQYGTATITATLDNQSRTTTIQVYRVVVGGPILNNRTMERFALIQDAINCPNTLNNDTIIVNSGTYVENVNFNKQLRLISNGTAIIQAATPNYQVIDLTVSASGSTIQGFIIRGASNAYGIRSNLANNLNITGNNITGNYYGIYFVSGSNNKIYQNNIYSNSYGIYLENSYTTVNFNRITNNPGYNIYGNGPLTDATNNWWGFNSPNGISGNVNPSPYLIMNINALPTLISTLNTSTITTDLTRNSNSQDTSSLGYLPDGIQINYSTNLGVINNTTKLINGKSTVILNPNSQYGTATITATLDNQSRTTTVQIYRVAVDGPILNNRTMERFALIQDAINCPNTLNGDTLSLIAGIYNEHDILVNKNLTITGPTITGNSTPTAVINAQTLGRAFYIPSGVNVTITYLLIQNGTVTTAPQYGGGIYTNGTLTIKNCTIQKNNATYGGGIFNANVMTLNDSNVYNNTAEYGGGIWNDNYTAILTNSIVSYNTATTTAGGGIYNYGGNLTLNDSGIYNNTADYNGGGIYNNAGNVNNVNSNIYNNTANRHGGGIYNTAGGNVTTTNSNVYNNNATNDGGGICNAVGGNVIITNSNLYNNTANDGGGILNYGILTLTNSSIDNNSATNNDGGAIYNAGTANLTNSSISNNIGRNGGAILNDENCAMNLLNSNLYNNIATNAGGAIYNNVGILTITNSSINNNSATNDDGGAIYNAGTVTVNRSNFNNNTAINGGAICTYWRPFTMTGTNLCNNTATGVGGGIYNKGSANVILNFCRIIGNSAPSGDDIYNTGALVDATLNWWGSNKNPSSKVVGSVTVTPWLVLNMTANPSVINVGGTSNITADLLYDSSGGYHNPASGYVPDGIPVSFNTTLGTINSSVSAINGAANVTLGSGSVGGVADVSAKVDNQTVQTSVTILNTEADVYIAMSASSASVVAGQDLLTFMLFVKNNGPSVASNVTINDNPADFSKLSNIQYSLNGSNWNSWSGSYWIGDMAPDSNQTIWIRGNVISSALGIINNTANVTTTTNDTTLGNNTANTVTSITTLADVYITQSASPNTVIAGQDNITFTIFIKNNGPSYAHNVTINDNSADLSKLNNLQYSTNGSNWSAWTGSYIIGDMAPGANQTILISGNVLSDAWGLINNTVNVTTTTPDPISENNTANTITVINTEADVYVNMSASPEPVVAGQDLLTYTILIGNNGPSVARSLIVKDNSADLGKLSNLEYSTNGSNWNTWTDNLFFGNLAPGADKTLWIRGFVMSDALGIINNTVNVTSTCQDVELSNNAPNIITTINTMADVFITKSAFPEPVIAGQDVLTFAIVIGNNGPSYARTVTLNDNSVDLVKLDNLEYSLDNLTWNNWPGIYLIGEMAPNVNQTFWIKGNVKNDATGVINNTANVSTTTSDPELANNSASTLTNINTVNIPLVINTRTLEEFLMIQDAINDADTLNGDTLNLTEGTFHEYDILVNKNLTISGPHTAANNTLTAVIDAQHLGRIFNILPGLNVTLQYLLIQNGNNDIIPLSPGGGIYLNQSTLTVNNCCFTGGTARWGGAIYSNQGTLVVNLSTFTCNSGDDAGAIFNEVGNLTVIDCNFTQNIATIWSGGAIFNRVGNATIIRCIFNENIADSSFDGGAIWNNGVLTVTDSIFNGSISRYGGAIYNYGTESMSTINNCNFTNNNANMGGTINNEGTCTVSNSNFTNNTASYGGAILNMDGSSTVDNCTFTDNSASYGGAIAAYSSGNMTLHSCNIYNNTATSNGGAIFNSANLTMHFNRVVNNSINTLWTNQPVNATNNWWGSNSNPSSQFAGNGTINYSSWLYMTLSADPLIINGTSCNITANFNNAFNGTDLTSLNPADGHLPDGLPVFFTTDFGNVGSKTTTKNTLNGIATALFTADEGIGIANVSGQFDNQITNTTIQIVPISVLNIRTQEWFDSIQEAIDDLDTINGDTIMVSGSLYVENVMINKILTLMSLSNTTINALKPFESVLTINSAGSGSTIQGFIISGATSSNGIILSSANNCNILNNTLTGNNMGILILGDHNNIIGNNASGNSWAGICLSGVTQNLVKNNTISGNPEGIYILNCNNCTFSDNVADSNSVNGLNIVGGSQNTLINNMVLNNGVSTNGNGIILKDTTLNTLDYNLVAGNGWSGIVLDNSSQNNIMDTGSGGNTITGNGNGLVLFNGCNNNIIAGNIFISNLYNGLELFVNCEYNQIYNNNIVSTLVTGLLVQYSNNNNVTGNTVNGSSFNGVALESANNNFIDANSITDSGSIGLILVSSNNNQITANELLSTFWTNIAMDQSSYNLIQGNTINGTGVSDNGVWFQGNCNWNNITSNVITENKANGVFIQSSENNLVNYNNISQNTGGAGMGLLLVASTSTVINHNTFQDNGWVGTCVSSDSNGNTITENNYISTSAQGSQAYDAGTNNYDNGTTGNYWSNWGSTDPRPIDGGSNVDNHPSLTQF